MIPSIGHASVLVGLGLTVYAAVAYLLAARGGDPRLAISARRAVTGSFVAAATGCAAMMISLLTHDFGVLYVAENNATTTPPFISIISLWAALEGSILFWTLLATGWASLVLHRYRNRHRQLMPWAGATLATVNAFFFAVMTWPGNPFALTSPVATEGSGPNALLQNHPFMALHPPLLYLGYTGLAVPFAFGIAALATRRLDEEWLRIVRRWTLIPWTFLTLGIVAGAWWSYEVLGWGGYWAWDPVENAALMPWLAATAFLHSVMIQEKRGMLRVWNHLLVVLAFSLSLFGTFLTRSGIVSSIHSFTESSIGPWFLFFICIVVFGSLALVFARLPLLRSKTRLESLVSREATFLYNNLLLVALTLTILWGVAYPILHEAALGESRIVGPGYYNFFLRAFGLPLLLLMGLGPLVAWRRASLRSLGLTFAWPAGFALLVGLVLLALGAGSSIPGLIAYTFSAFVLGSIALEFLRGTRARRALSGGSWPGAFSALIGRNRRRYGGYVVHAAIVLLAIGVAGSSAYDSVNERRLAPGDSLAVGDYRLTYRGLEEREAANATEIRAVLGVERDGEALGTVKAGKNAYTAERQVSNEVGIRSDLVTGEDLFVIVGQINANGTVEVRAFVKPLVNLIWLAGLVFVLGALITLWPDAREQRRLALRYEGAEAPART